MRRAAVLIALVLLAQIALAQSFASQRQVHVEQYLRAIDFIGPFRAGIEREKERAGRTTPFIEFVLNADDAVIERHVARVYAKHLTDREAAFAAAFYQSAAGRYITQTQKLQPNETRTPIYLAPEHAEDYRQFVATGTEKVLEVLTSDRRVWIEIMVELEKAQVR